MAEGAPVINAHGTDRSAGRRASCVRRVGVERRRAEVAHTVTLTVELVLIIVRLDGGAGVRREVVVQRVLVLTVFDLFALSLARETAHDGLRLVHSLGGIIYSYLATRSDPLLHRIRHHVQPPRTIVLTLPLPRRDPAVTISLIIISHTVPIRVRVTPSPGLAPRRSQRAVRVRQAGPRPTTQYLSS